MARCKDCQRYYNLTVNTKKVRKHGRTPSLRIAEAEFLDWATSGEPACVYCGITDTDLSLLAIKSSIGLVVAALGIDRVDNDGDYEIGNIAFCCYACNKAKGNVFTSAEMASAIGPAIAQVWQARLSEAIDGTP